MSQNDFVIANDTAANVRADINDALEAIATNNSGTTEPSVTYANQWWYDSDNDILKIRSEADDAWINVGYLDQSTNEFKPYVGSTQVDTQSTATWEAGTSTTEGIVSPAKVAASAEVNSPVKAWVNFDGTGTVAIRESFNVSSITDNGTGLYTVNFATAFADTNYALIGGCEATEGSSSTHNVVLEEESKPATGSCRINTRTVSFSFDSSIVNVLVVR